MSTGMSLDGGGRARRGARRGRRLVLWGGLFLALFVAFCWFRVGPAPEITIDPELPAVGPATAVAVSVSEPRRGLGTVKVRWSQGENGAELVAERFEPRSFWSFWGPRKTSQSYDLTLGPSTLEGLEEGIVTLEVSASRAGTWLRHPEAVSQTLDLPVRLRPPALETLGGPYYATQGGSGLVVYRVGAESRRDGVQAGEWWFPGYPLPGGSEGERFCLFGVSRS